MNVQEIAKVSSKGQITIPNKIRNYLHLKENQFISFEITNQGVMFFPVEIQKKMDFTEEEWMKIDKLKKQKGKVFKTGMAAKKYLNSL